MLEGKLTEWRREEDGKGGRKRERKEERLVRGRGIRKEREVIEFKTSILMCLHIMCFKNRL